jgi:hypothetical protein
MSSEEKATNPIDDLFGEPPLLKGEDKARYMRLRAAVEAEINPKTIFDQIMVRDLTDKYWDEQRIKRNAAALTKGAFMQALQILLEPICKGTNEIAAQMSLDYYRTDPREKKALAVQLAQYGITIEMIEARAMQIAAPGLQAFDRMIANRETSRRHLRKELERRPKRDDADIASPAVPPDQVVVPNKVVHN